MRNAIETMPYVGERTFRDPTARIAVEWVTHSEKIVKPKRSSFPVKLEAVAFFLKNDSPKVGEIPTIRQRIHEIEDILRGFNQKKKNRLSREDQTERKGLLAELKRIKQRLI